MAPTNLVYLSLMNNFSIFIFELLENKERASEVAAETHEKAMKDMDKLED